MRDLIDWISGEDRAKESGGQGDQLRWKLGLGLAF